jgi:transposase
MSKLSRKTYSETFKLEVLRDYYSSGLSKITITKKWGLNSHVDLLRWIKRYPIDSDLLSLSAELLAELHMKNSPKSKEQLLEEEVLRLKKALEIEKLRSHAFKKLIELTEKEEGISILKKDGAK